MTKRAVIITSSVLVAILIAITILFGVVFRVRDIRLKFDENFCYQNQIDEIISASKLKKNSSIFKLDRDKISNNIEKAYPYARVSVNLDSLTSVKIVLSNREPMYYFVQENVYYILDEDCKILEITTDENKANPYILLDNVFSVTEQTEVGEFLDNKYTDTCTNLYKTLYLYVGEDMDNDGVLDKQNITRQDILEVIRNVKFVSENELYGKKDKLIITTDASNGYGVKITIIEPQKDLDYKINSAFSAFRALQRQDKLEGTNLIQSGSINIIYQYDNNGNVSVVCEYRA